MAVRRHGRTGGTALTAALVTAVAALAAGCSGGRLPADSQNAAATADAAAVVRRAAAVLEREGSSRAHTAMEMASGGTRVTVRGYGVYDYRRRHGRLAVSLPADPAGRAEHRPITELLAPGALFMKNRGAGVPADKWVRVDTGSLTDGNLVTGGATDPLAAAQILAGAGSVRYVGAGELAGAPVRHYRGVADLARAARAVGSGGSGGAALAAAAKGFSKAEVPFDVYLDGAGRLRKVRHRFSFAARGAGRPVAVTSTTLLYGFGVPVEVRLPTGDDIYTGRIAEPQ
ncbi:hypothetical protein [Streptomyces sp. NPDC058045]|uniref:hypothetical protein n=1 Tax=Streptomyces sp. NPDC058045 TaxID=3346311 RepID=UPI0036E9EC66